MKNTNTPTSRRSFLRVVGGVGLTSAIAPGYLMGKATDALKDASTDGILVETANFDNLGGWKLDTQHIHQMGGVYLLAHGMGKPVENASTEIDVPTAGDYHIFIRTRDWCKADNGEWESPGRFKVHVNGTPLDTVFGQQNEAWSWHEGGSVTLPAGKTTIALEDLTGFDGRCDAIYLSPSATPKLPNDDLPALAAWKDTLSGRADMNIEEKEFDVVIVGGGMTGCGAALAAISQEGMKVALIQDRPLFGGNASQEIRVHTIGIRGYGTDLIKTIDTKHYPNGHEDAKKDQIKREATMAASGVDLFAGHFACGLQKEGRTIKSVEARDIKTGVITRFKAPVFIDCTGDGWLGFWSGCEFRHGRESYKEFGEQWEKHGELWAPEKADMQVMGTSVLWNGVKTKERQTFPDVPWAMPVAGKHAATKGEWYWEYSNEDLHQIKDAEQIRDHMLRAIYGSFANAKKQPKNATYTLKWVAYVGGKRESRRLMGDHIFTMQDATSKTKFPDAVAVEKRELDTHFQRKLKGAKQDFLSTALFYKTHGTYYIPFRSLYVKDMDNLMMGGRCFSCSHIGLSGPRVMLTCAQMGIAIGFASALCKKHNANPKQVGQSHIKELQKLIGIDKA